MDISKYFDTQELVCKHVYDKLGEKAINYLDKRLLETIAFIREKINKPIYVNNWQIGGTLSQRGLRCNMCQLVKDKTNSKTTYVSAHILGKAIDFDVKGWSADKTREWILSNANALPYPIRIESDVNWVHVDLMNNTDRKVITFKA